MTDSEFTIKYKKSQPIPTKLEEIKRWLFKEEKTYEPISDLYTVTIKRKTSKEQP